MPKQKQDVERQLSNKELDSELSKVTFRSLKSQKIFKEISSQTWFRQYAKGSRGQLKKITEKVKKGIRHGKYSYMSLMTGTPEQPRGTTKKPKKTKAEKKIEQKQAKIKKTGVRKQREKIKQEERRAPSGRKYSYTEIHEGLRSKRAKEWRKKQGISEKDV